MEIKEISEKCAALACFGKGLHGIEERIFHYSTGSIAPIRAYALPPSIHQLRCAFQMRAHVVSIRLDAVTCETMVHVPSAERSIRLVH